MNDNDREEWVNNDEGLYQWWQSSNLSMRAFLRENRADIDAAINQALGKGPNEACEICGSRTHRTSEGHDLSRPQYWGV